MYILGDSFLRGYYSIYDFENNKVGLAAHPNSLSLEWQFPPWGVVLIVILCLLIMAIIGFLIYRRYKRKRIEYQLANHTEAERLVEERIDGNPASKD